MTRQAPSGDDRYRVIDEARIIEILLVRGWAFAVRAGARGQAEREARAVLERCVAKGLRYRHADGGGRLFDPAEVVNVLQWAGLQGNEPAWEQVVDTAQRSVWEAYPNAGDRGVAPSPDTLGPERYAVTITRTFNLEDRRSGERMRLRLPLPIEDATLGDLRIAFLPPPGPPVETRVAPARLDALIPAPEDGQATIGVRAEFTARPVTPAAHPTGLDPSERALYSRPSEGLIKVSDRVRSVADALAGAEADAATLVRRLWNVLLDEFAFGVVRYDELDPARPVDWVLEHGYFDCQLGSALFCSLCRARGFPARLVSGYLLRVVSPSIHTWLEVWIEGAGWVPFDLGAWELSAGGREEGWRDYYFGRLDHRLTAQRPPRLFNGPGDVRLPHAWQMLIAPDRLGNSIAFHGLETGALAYREHIEVERLG